MHPHLRHPHPFSPWLGARAPFDEEVAPPRPPRWFAMAGGPRRGPGPRPERGGGPGGHGPGFGGHGFGGPGFGGPFGGRGSRARRGDVRVAILRLLAEQPMHGYQIIQELSSRTGGIWNPSPGSVYPTLAALEDQGLIRADDVDGKRVFQLTDAGRADVGPEAGRSAAPWEDVAAGTGGYAELRDVVMGVVGAARQVAAAGTSSQLERAVALLRETRRRLYQLLAEDPETPAEQ